MEIETNPRVLEILDRLPDERPSWRKLVDEVDENLRQSEILILKTRAMMGWPRRR